MAALAVASRYGLRWARASAVSRTVSFKRMLGATAPDLVTFGALPVVCALRHWRERAQLGGLDLNDLQVGEVLETAHDEDEQVVTALESLVLITGAAATVEWRAH